MNSLPADPHRFYPDHLDDAAMDAAWISQCEADDARDEDALADAECTAEAARVARIEADAAVQEAERLEALAAKMRQTTEGRIYCGTIAIMENIIDMLEQNRKNR